MLLQLAPAGRRQSAPALAPGASCCHRRGRPALHLAPISPAHVCPCKPALPSLPPAPQWRPPAGVPVPGRRQGAARAQGGGAAHRTVRQQQVPRARALLLRLPCSAALLAGLVGCSVHRLRAPPQPLATDPRRRPAPPAASPALRRPPPPVSSAWTGRRFGWAAGPSWPPSWSRPASSSKLSPTATRPPLSGACARLSAPAVQAPASVASPSRPALLRTLQDGSAIVLHAPAPCCPLALLRTPS